MAIIQGLLATLLVLFLTRIVYNLYLHPLRNVPGPLLWRASRLPYVFSLCSGSLVQDIQAIHAKYGDIARLAPDEVSFVHPDAMQEIYIHRAGHAPFPRNGIWRDVIPGQHESIVSLPTGKDHARIRKAMSGGFTKKALAAQEGILRKYADLLVKQLTEHSRRLKNEGKEPILDVASWYNYASFDIMGDFTFAESFGCLEDSVYHPWVAIILENVKAICFLISIRLIYRPMEKLLVACMPAKAKQAMDDHYRLSCEKIYRRLGKKEDRPDFMSYVLQQGPLLDSGAVSYGSKTGKGSSTNPPAGMTREEVEASFNTVIIAGSETTATALTCLTNHLVRYPEAKRKLCEEVRTAFATDEEITVARLEELPYLDAVLNETLRLGPPVATGIPHVAPEGGDKVCGVWMPGGTHAGVATYATHRHPALFHDPERFVPERWLRESTEDRSSPFFNDVRSAMQPFGFGKRQCLGVLLAWAELRLIAAKMVWSFDIERAETKNGLYAWEELRTYQLWEKRPFEVRLHERR